MSHRSRSNQNRIPLVALVAFGLTGATLVACEHSDDLKAVREAGKAGGQVGGDGDGGKLTAPRYFTEGEDPTVALATTEEVVDSGPSDFVVGPAERTSCGDEPVRDLYTTDPAITAEAEGLVQQMTLEQKVIQLTGVDIPNYDDPNRWRDIQRSRDDDALGIRGYQWRDGPHGINLEAGIDYRTDQPRKTTLKNYSTSFPTSVVQGAAFDFDLARRVGEAMGDETVASGHNVLLAPCMNILRNPLWGRAQETFGEDSFHLGRIATAVTIGIQKHVTGCAKHYIANNIELQRMSINVEIDEQTARETYGRHFEMVSRDGGIGCVMASYNLVNGKKLTQHEHLLTQVLKYDFGFRGFVLTDWWAMPADGLGQGGKSYTIAQRMSIAEEAIKAGLDIEVPWAIHFSTLPQLVQEGRVPVQYVDRAVTRVLEQKLRWGTAYKDSPWGPQPTVTGYDVAEGKITNSEPHVALAAEAAEKGAVLLKNEGILPIPEATKKVAVIGAKIEYAVKSDGSALKTFDFARDVALGDRGSSRVLPDPALSIGPFDGLSAHKHSGTEVIAGNTAAEVGDADFVVVVVGLTSGDEGEEYTGAADRDDLSIPLQWDANESAELKAAKPRPKTLDQNKLVTDVLALGKPTVVVIEAGGVIDAPWLDSAKALVMAWYPGQRAGDALGRLLFGHANFSGRLPVTWPRSLDQFPTFTLGDTVANPMEFNVGYRWFDEKGHTPRYAFGHGLSYTTFAYEGLDVGCGDVTANGIIRAQVTVRNTGERRGAEVIQLYVSFPESKVRRPKKELRGFARVELDPGEAKRVTIPVRVRDLKYFDMTRNDWAIEEGPVEIRVGGSSDALLPPQTVMVRASSN
ncbi:MAG: hypothetical protein B6A08_16955 [Sorangiineae bacterium NIC37A_2]|jgi:beta-glucosidase|nr:MAG: hypothetical protein B6A08_16955 [Sorangiineae bacterium NIC37A_2]